MNTPRVNAQARAMRRITLIAIVVACVLAPGSSWSQNQMYIYPAKGQTQQQQDKDRYECHTWAVQQTGFDPSRAYPSNPNYYDPQPARSGQVVKGAAGGAALGAIGGAIGGNAGKGAAIGAGVGAGAGALKRRQDRNQQASAQQQQQQAQAQAQNAKVQGYQRAMAACLQGRGYTVN
jgi:hypothetical protein